jgi:hypothetical protein
MDIKSSGTVIRSFVLIALVTPTIGLTIRGHDIEPAPPQDQTTRNQAGSAPVILAQGRCFNGRCY